MTLGISFLRSIHSIRTIMKRPQKSLYSTKAQGRLVKVHRMEKIIINNGDQVQKKKSPSAQRRQIDPYKVCMKDRSPKGGKTEI